LADLHSIMASSNERDPNSLPNRKGAADSSAAVGREDSGEEPVLQASIGSGLLKQATSTTDEHVAVAKVCPQCGGEYETGDRFCPKDGAPLRPKGSADPMIGRIIAERYLILARLGEGGMGRVYVAEHVKMNRQCAIKVMSPSLMNDAESTTRFAREASNAARILHPNVAAVFDYGEADKTVYLVMEYVDGESLSSLLAREGALDPRRAIDIGRQIADGLTAAHELGIVHRDLKPDNVIVAMKRDGREIAKVVDFGIAKAVSDLPKDALTRSGLVIGTPEYMSPEQLLGDPVDARTDIYALGCMLYQMLTGMQPFDAETREQMIRRRLNEASPHIQAQIPELPRRLDTLIAHMLARAPNERLGSAAAVSAGLDPAVALAGWEPAHAAPVSARVPRGAPTVIHASADPAMQPTIPIKLSDTSPKRILIGSVVVSAIVIGGAFVWSQWDMRRAATTTLPAPVATQPAAPVDSAAPDTTTTTLPQPIVAESVTVPPTKATTTPKTEAGTKAAKRPALPPDEAAIQETLTHFAMAVGNGEVAVRNEFPGIPTQLLDGLKQIYSQNERIKATAQLAKPAIAGAHAEVTFVLRLSYVDRTSKQPGTFPFRYRATMAKRDGKWELTDLSALP
jgi:serine/threonine protein kinase